MLLFATTRGQDSFTKRSPPPVSAEAKSEMETKLKEAQAHYEANPNSADAMIWVGRRLAYLGRFTEAIDTYTKGIARFPNDAVSIDIAVTVRSLCGNLIWRSPI